MSYDAIVSEWLDALGGLNVRVKRMFGCCCLYCDGQPVGWIHNGVLSLREVGLDYLPAYVKRPGKQGRIQEVVIPPHHARSDWLARAVLDTADARKRGKQPDANNG